MDEFDNFQPPDGSFRDYVREQLDSPLGWVFTLALSFLGGYFIGGLGLSVVSTVVLCVVWALALSVGWRWVL